VVRRNSDRGKLSRTNDLVSSAINCKAERERAESFFLDPDLNKMGRKTSLNNWGNLNSVF